MLELDDMELFQLQFCMKETKKMMMHPSEHRRHASITEKVEAEMERRKNATGAYTPEGVLRDLQRQIDELSQG